MKLNHECVRDLMLAFEDVPYGGHPQMGEIVKFKKMGDYSIEDVCYSTEKLMEAGFIDFQRVKAWGAPFDGIFVEITWDGHEFIDSIRSDTVWNKAKEKVKSTVSNVSIQTMAAVAIAVTKNMLSI
ncbi:DUF2513 domain-containing protein [Latilactobacillus curvatus]